MLSTSPDRNSIYAELVQSNFRQGGTDVNGLEEMHNYVFGNTNYSREAFGDTGIPTVQTDILLNTLPEFIDVNFTVDDNGGLSGGAEVIAQYWVNGSPSTAQTVSLGTGYNSLDADTQGFSVTGDETYSVRITVINAYNNSGNYPDPTPTGVWDWSETATTYVPLQDWDTPSITECFYHMINDEVHAEWNQFDQGSGHDQPSDYFAQTYSSGVSSWVDSTESATVNWGASTNPKEANWTYAQNDPLQFRVRAEATTARNASNYDTQNATVRTPNNVSISQDSPDSGDVTVTWNNPVGY